MFGKIIAKKKILIKNNANHTNKVLVKNLAQWDCAETLASAPYLTIKFK